MLDNTAMKLTISLNNLPIYLDGGDGALWPARDAWEIMLSEPTESFDVATRRYIRASDLIALLRKSGIELVYEDVITQ